VAVKVGVGDGVFVEVPVGEDAAVGVADGVAVPVGLEMGVVVNVPVGLENGVGVKVSVGGVPVTVTVIVPTGVALIVPTGVGVCAASGFRWMRLRPSHGVERNGNVSGKGRSLALTPSPAVR